jgi:heterodisulfide reductase subunit C2
MSTISAELSRRVSAGSGEQPLKCYQCKRCSIGCPVAPFADLHPAQIMRAVQLGDYDAAVGSRMVWLCTGCETCTTRCPQGIDIAAVMDELRIIGRQDGVVRKDAAFANVLKLNLDSMKRWGRIYEMEMLALDKITRPSTMMDDMGLGVKMILKGKIGFKPGFGDRAQMKRMIAEADRVEAERRAEREARAAERATGASPDPAEGGEG